MPRIIKAAKVQAFQHDPVVLIESQGKEIVLCAVGGSFYAIDNVCTHQYASLAEGWLEGYNLTCPLHGAQFDVRTGAAACLPAVEDVQRYSVTVSGEDILIEIDDL